MQENLTLTQIEDGVIAVFERNRRYGELADGLVSAKAVTSDTDKTY